MRRILGASFLRYIIKTSVTLRFVAPVGSTIDVYAKWAKEVKLPVVVDELGGGARLLWLGPKRLDHVVLFVHGGGFAVPPRESYLMFWHHVRLEMEKKGVEPGIVMLNYTFASSLARSNVSQATRPMRRAVEFLLAAGFHPNRIQLAGNSAGGNIILQLLSRILHPHPGVDDLNLAAPFSAIHLLSPWVDLKGDSPSYDENDGIDYMPKSALVWQSGRILADVPEKDRVFAEAAKAPPAWFVGVDRLVDSVLLTAGEKEVMRDDILKLGVVLEKHHPRVEVVIQPGGFHEDMFLDFDWGEGMLTPLIIDRLIAGCE